MCIEERRGIGWYLQRLKLELLTTIYALMESKSREGSSVTLALEIAPMHYCPVSIKGGNFDFKSHKKTRSNSQINRQFWVSQYILSQPVTCNSKKRTKAWVLSYHWKKGSQPAIATKASTCLHSCRSRHCRQPSFFTLFSFLAAQKSFTFLPLSGICGISGTNTCLLLAKKARSWLINWLNLDRPVEKDYRERAINLIRELLS